MPTDIRHLAQWKATVEQVRDACLESRIIAMNMPGLESNWITNSEIEHAASLAQDAVRGSRMFECGHLPNEIIKMCGKRGGLMYTAGLLGHPFIKPWLLYHTWEEGTAVYVIDLHEPEQPAGGTTEITEFIPMIVDGMKILIMGDRVVFCSTESDETRYGGYAKQCSWRIGFAKLTGQVPGSAMNNCLDPFVTALLLLHTDGVPVDRISPPEKLQKARLKAGKPSLPSRLRIDSGTYVTVLGARKQRLRASLGGTHASPIPHRRLGHWRHFKNGRPRIRIPDALVNVKDETRTAFMRSHYNVKREPPRPASSIGSQAEPNPGISRLGQIEEGNHELD
jgi:hypothetical protein